MDDLKETIQLDVDEENELLFKVNVEGTSGTAKVRLVCEDENMSYMFDGHPTNESGVVQFIIPKMNNLKSEILNSKIEVLIENKYFSPVEFGIQFKKTVQVFAEAVQVPRKLSQRQPTVSVIAMPVQTKKREEHVIVSEGLRPALIEKPKQGSLAERYIRRKKM